MVQGPGPPGRYTESVVVRGGFKPIYRQVSGEDLIGKIEGRGPWAGFHGAFMLPVAPEGKLTFVADRVAIPVSPLPDHSTGR